MVNPSGATVGITSRTGPNGVAPYCNASFSLDDGMPGGVSACGVMLVTIVLTSTTCNCACRPLKVVTWPSLSKLTFLLRSKPWSTTRYCGSVRMPVICPGSAAVDADGATPGKTPLGVADEPEVELFMAV